MDCPACGAENTSVLETFKGDVERRRRKCSCGVTFKSTETVDKGSIRHPLVPISGDRSPGIPPGGDQSPPVATDSDRGVGGGLSSGSDPGRNPDPNQVVSDPPDRAREPAALSPFRAPYRPASVGAATPSYLVVYNAYPKKIGKGAAAQVFQEIAADYPGGEAALSEAILRAFRAGMLRQHPYNGEDKHRPSLERFLAERRWEDDQSTPDDPERPRAAAGSEYRRLD